MERFSPQIIWDRVQSILEKGEWIQILDKVRWYMTTMNLSSIRMLGFCKRTGSLTLALY